MKLDTSRMKYLTSDDFRVLQAVELGSRNHELVPTQMIHSIGGLRSPSGTNRAIGDLAKIKLVARLRNASYDGFRLTYLGFDYLALKALLNRESIYSMGATIGVGKESDIFSTSDNHGTQKVLKVHRLGRTSFRTVKNNRDYLKNRKTSNWMYLSRLAAEKEYQFMEILYSHGFEVPIPYDQSRHCVLMEWIDGIPMKNLRKYEHYKKLYSDLMMFIVKLANHGIIHCDFNEFNIIINKKSEDSGRDFTVIDFPQCVSIDHLDAKQYFDRDVQGIRSFFAKKFRYEPKHDATMFDTEGYGEGYKYAYPDFQRDVKRIASLDIEVSASGYKKKTKVLREDTDLENAVMSMRINAESLNEHESDSTYTEEEGDEYQYDDDDDDDDEEQENELLDFEDAEGLLAEEAEKEENERIISALSSGVGNLKMDSLGNYILD